MMYLAIALFALSAVLGVAILWKWMSKQDASKGVIYSHGIVAAGGLGVLVFYALQNPGAFPKVSLILFAVAAVAGFYMFFRDLAKKTSPMGLAFTHALVAVAGFVALLAFVFA